MKFLDNLIFMPNRAWTPQVKVPRLMFYHLPKTGGSYVYNSLSGALLLLSQIIAANNPGFPGFKYDRIDKPEAREWLKHLWLVATHLPYGWHFDYQPQPAFQLFTLVRDPFERVLSDYTYTCMRKGQRTTVEEFLEFAALEENRNIMVRHFCGDTPDSPLDVANVMRILERDFLAYDTTEHIPEMIEGLLNHANLPNVMVQGRINYTLDEYKLDAADLRPRIEAENRADLELYSEIQAHPRRLPIPGGETYHPATILMQETGGSEGSMTLFQSVATAQVLDRVAQSQTGKEVFAHYFK
jgi:hypothetical protein